MEEKKKVTKQYLAEQVVKMLGGGIQNRDSKITMRQAMAVVGEMRNKLLWNELLQRYKLDSAFNVPSSVLSEFTVTSYEEKNKWYIDLPVPVLSLYNDMGIYQVFSDCDEYFDIIPNKTTFKSMYRDFPSSDIEGQSTYIPRGDRMELLGIDKALDIELVLVVDSVSLSPRGDFKFIGELQDDLLTLSVEKMKLQAGIPQDNVLDNLEKGRQ